MAQGQPNTRTTYTGAPTHFPQYNDIAEIIGNNLAIGDNAFSSVQGTLIEENEPEAERGSPGNEGDGPEDVEQEADEEENEESQESSQTMVTPSQVCGKLWTLSTSSDKTF